ncbi:MULTISPECIES: hypothetical protein [unclassified Prochlorococcus]|uniref:hypothetical protein n=1 Tax=unclassified Prochlorococcus TaxID=2627481 RepID=UPI000533A3AB|nr:MULTISPECIES: hypothetical protein [unclassified Prochlorococcus]KGG28938.1 hypothetical protein EV12_0350 [Prochlorococcus sp. MIT 0701]KGG30632.1 hypothetical protein EV13_0137 [Prochlorococcus sp. MIT 0702]KGG36647.1 hypothetical protein EV14_0203 [Prochlorococcus sp. MIT 0703]
MTEPNETNEEVNEELSSDELKGVSGGVMSNPQYEGLSVREDGPHGSSPQGSGYGGSNCGQGSGYGGTRNDWDKLSLKKAKRAKS